MATNERASTAPLFRNETAGDPGLIPEDSHILHDNGAWQNLQRRARHHDNDHTPPWTPQSNVVAVDEMIGFKSNLDSAPTTAQPAGHQRPVSLEPAE